MGERQLDLASLPGTTSDGRDIEADVHIHCRVVDPYEFVTNVAFFEEAVESLTSKLVRETAPQLMLDAATQTRSIEQALEMSLTTTLGRWGVECLEVRVEAGLATSRRADPLADPLRVPGACTVRPARIPGSPHRRSSRRMRA